MSPEGLGDAERDRRQDTHTFTQDERAAAERLGELFGTSWPEKTKGELTYFPNLSQKLNQPAESNQQAVANQ